MVLAIKPVIARVSLEEETFIPIPSVKPVGPYCTLQLVAPPVVQKTLAELAVAPNAPSTVGGAQTGIGCTAMLSKNKLFPKAVFAVNLTLLVPTGRLILYGAHWEAVGVNAPV